jgi:ribosome-binding factor A
MTRSRVSEIKHAQRQSFLFHEIASFFQQISADDPVLRDIFISRVQLSPDRGMCSVYFACQGGEPMFKERLKQLVLYKPSMRAALAKVMHSRYTPDLTFKYDTQIEKQRKLDDLFERIKSDE